MNSSFSQKYCIIEAAGYKILTWKDHQQLVRARNHQHNVAVIQYGGIRCSLQDRLSRAHNIGYVIMFLSLDENLSLTQRENQSPKVGIDNHLLCFMSLLESDFFYPIWL